MLTAGLVDELSIHLSPVLVGGGTRLFDQIPPAALIQGEVIASLRATHLVYEVARSDGRATPPH